jgi:hypothetical protein
MGATEMITQPVKALGSTPTEEPPVQNQTALNLYTVKQFPLAHPAFTASSLRNLIFNAAPRYSSKGEVPGNGLLECGAIIRLGRKILIDERAFLEWVRGKACNPGGAQLNPSTEGMPKHAAGGK